MIMFNSYFRLLYQRVIWRHGVLMDNRGMNDILKWMLMGYPWLMMVHEYWRLDEFIVTKKSGLTIIRSSHSSPATMSDNATEARLRLTHLCRLVV